MANVSGAYSAVEDLYKGDIPLQPHHGDGTKAIQAAADDIDAQIGHIYRTPITVSDEPEHRPTRLLLKKINNLIASGRLMLDMAAAGQDDNLNAYGLSMLREGMTLLGQIQKGEIALAGVTRIDESKAPEGPSIQNEDAVSLVEQFYNPMLRRQMLLPGMASLPYSGNN